MHYYTHHIGDYRRDTMHLTLLEHGVYRQLLDLYYLHECELDANALRLICARSAEEVQAAENVLNEFFTKSEKGWMHKRCDAEIESFRAKSEKAKNSANARWRRCSGEDNANAMRTHSEGNANHKPITNNQYINTFDIFWKAWPASSRKASKSKCLEVWKRINPDEQVLNRIIQHIGAVVGQCEDKFRPAPLVYLNQRRWDGWEGTSVVDDQFAGMI